MASHLPPNLAKIPRSELIFDQVPIIQPLNRLRTALGGPEKCPALWIAREDCNSGLAFGGNKVRKLEYVVHEALEQGCDTLVTTGGIQSNHMRQTAAAAGFLGMKAVLVPKDMVTPEDRERYGQAGNVQINSILGAETLPLGTSEERAMEHVRSRGGKPYWIPSGASEHPLGGLGYARWMCQVAEWEAVNGKFFDAIVCTAGGCSTFAGIVVGSKLVAADEERRKRRLVAIGIFAQSEEVTVETTLRIARRTCEQLGLPQDAVEAADFEVDMRFNAGAYGKMDNRTAEAVKLVAGTEGILLDPVYTGKTMAGLLDKVRSGELRGVENLLFVHTGGQAAMGAYPQLQ
ncbi:hypothetical protein LTR56_014007 [Elasticomyces elasticus]|nr:hypothetical protein LTR56_014007 [Elasticomyces elasticus]KAK3652028.1 hypothetical protein LTR22_011817 [Elasticomyces elasticus]KAK4912406.1 hypothetical protein LTR49_019123 [Elasticomyces elasticus]KAK5751647.1 hypothetical protein LTS12_018259 [Elasticomyces elasticus]